MKQQDLDIIEQALNYNSIDAKTKYKILDKIEELLLVYKEEAKAEKNDKLRKKFVFLTCDPDGILEGKELTGYVVQIPEDQSEFSVEQRISTAAYEYNRTRKGQRNPVKTIAEACEVVPARIFKDQEVWVKNKEAAFLLPTNGLLDRPQTTMKF